MKLTALMNVNRQHQIQTVCAPFLLHSNPSLSFSILHLALCLCLTQIRNVFDLKQSAQFSMCFLLSKSLYQIMRIWFPILFILFLILIYLQENNIARTHTHLIVHTLLPPSLCPFNHLFRCRFIENIRFVISIFFFFNFTLHYQLVLILFLLLLLLLLFLHQFSCFFFPFCQLQAEL